MAYINHKNTPLIEEQRELLKALESEKDSGKLQKISKRLGELEKEIRINTIEHLKNLTIKNAKVIDAPKEFDAKTLKKILRKKYDVYKDVALQCRQLYSEVVEKKKDIKKLDELLKKKINDNTINLVLQY